MSIKAYYRAFTYFNIQRGSLVIGQQSFTPRKRRLIKQIRSTLRKASSEDNEIVRALQDILLKVQSLKQNIQKEATTLTWKSERFFLYSNDIEALKKESRRNTATIKKLFNNAKSAIILLFKYQREFNSTLEQAGLKLFNTQFNPKYLLDKVNKLEKLDPAHTLK